MTPYGIAAKPLASSIFADIAHRAETVVPIAVPARREAILNGNAPNQHG